MLCIEALQFVATAPERRDIHVATRARWELGQGHLVAREALQNKPLQATYIAWPVTCFLLARLALPRQPILVDLVGYA